ncbi:APC family permease [Spirillospora sp. NPDC127200]
MSSPSAGGPPTATASLRTNALSTADIAFFVVSAAAPLTVMAGVAPLGLLRGGIGAPAAYLAAGLTLTVFAVGFTTMSRHVRHGGGFYAYITRGLGRPAGFAAALLALLGYLGMGIGVYGLLGSATHATLLSLTGWNLPWPAIAIAGLLVIWYGGFRSISFGAKVLGVLLVAETGILVLLAAAVLAKGGAHGLSLDAFAAGNLTAAGMPGVLAMAFAAFTGFESTVIYRREAKDPARTVPRATYIAVAFLGLFYAFIVWTIIQAVGDRQVVAAAAEDPSGLFFTAIGTYVGPWAADAMHVLIVSSLIASLLAFHNATNRYGLALAEEGVLPKALGRIHSEHGSPYVAGLAQTLLGIIVVTAFALAGADPYTQLLIWVNTPGMLALLTLQLLVALAVPLYFRKPAHDEGAVRTVVAPAAAVLLLGTALWLVVSNIGLLTDASDTVNTVLLVPVPLVLLAGLGYALWARSARPGVYAAFAAEPDEHGDDGAAETAALTTKPS